MFAILLPTTFAGDIFFWNSHFGVNQFGKTSCEIILVEFAAEAVQPTWGRQSFLVFHDTSL